MRRLASLSVALFALAFAVMLCGCGGSDGPGEGAAGKPPPAPLTNPAFAYSNSGGLWVADSTGSVAKQLTRKYDADPAWSPDGSSILFRRKDSPTHYGNLYTIKPDGTDLALLHDFDSANTEIRPAAHAEWFPDGTRLIYNCYADLIVMDISTTTHTFQNLDTGILVAFPAYRVNPSIGPDLSPEPGFQGLIACEAGVEGQYHAIEVIRVATGAGGALTLEDGPEYVDVGSDAYPVFSSSGDRIAFFYRPGGDETRIRVVPVNADTLAFGSPQDVTTHTSIWGFNGRTSWSPDDQWISGSVFSGYTRQGLTLWDAFRVHSDGSSDRVWVTSTKDQVGWGGPDWNPKWVIDLP